MINVRKSEDRGQADHGWLKTFHTFSFASYFDPAHTKFRALRVINEDWIQGGQGFGTHPHENMEIITYIVEGELEHKDSMGNGSVIRPGELQRMTAGIGVTHSEFNPSREKTHLLQIWIYPETINLQPGYEQRDFSGMHVPNELTLLASRDGRNSSLTVHQEVDIFGSLLASGRKIEYTIQPGRHLWIQLIKGGLNVNGTPLKAGDGAALSDESNVTLQAEENSEFLIFDLA
jgi:redox-sensitive bicupin YhaK (pirin superfamily)